MWVWSLFINCVGVVIGGDQERCGRGGEGAA